jgi:O-antigen ligase
VELLAAFTICAWMALASRDGWRTHLPTRSILVALVVIVIVTLAAAIAAIPEASRYAAQWTARQALAWGLFLVAIDLRPHVRITRWVMTSLLLGCTTSALIGWWILGDGSPDGAFGVQRLITIGGTSRMAGTWSHPNIAAAAWSAAIVGALPLLVIRRRRLMQAMTLACISVLVVALLLTYTRGALLGAAIGFGFLGVIGIWSRGRALVGLAVASAGVLTVGVAVLYLTGPVPLARLTSEGDTLLYGASYEVAGRIAIEPGATGTIPVTVTNRGAMNWEPGGDHPVQLSARWLNPVTGEALESWAAATPIYGSVAAGQSATVQSTLQAPGAWGRYLIAWDMRQVGLRHFSERRVPVAVTEILVFPGAGLLTLPSQPAGLKMLWPGLIPEVTRPQRWAAALEVLARNPALGIGPGAFALVYGRYLGLDDWDTRSHSHNLYLELGATTGIAGLSAFLWLVIVGLRPQVTALVRSGGRSLTRRELLLAGCLAAAIALLVHSSLDYLFHSLSMAALFWVVLGLGLGLSSARHTPVLQQRPAARSGARRVPATARL